MAESLGFQGLLYYGAAGSTATTQITDARDISVKIEPEKASTTKRGDGLTVPIKTEAVVAIGWSMDFSIVNDSDDAVCAALFAAAVLGNPLAFRAIPYLGGLGYDGDCTFSFQHGMPLAGEQQCDITATPTCESDRDPSLNV